MNRLKLLFIITFFLPFSNYTSAQVNFTTHQYYNPFSINPAMISIDDKKVLSFYSKNIDARNNFYSFEFPVEDLNSNIGISVNRFVRTGSTSTRVLNKYNFAYSYKYKISETTNLRLGMQLTYIAGSVFENSTSTRDWTMLNDYSFGFALVRGNLKLGGSLINLSDREVFYQGSSFFVIRQVSHVVFSSSYKISLPLDFDFIPAVLIRVDDKTISFTDLTSYISYKEKIFMGLTYREAGDDFYDNEKEFIILAGVKLWKKLNVQISVNTSARSDEVVQFLTQFIF